MAESVAQQLNQLLENLKATDDSVRTQAEATLQQIREQNARDLYQGFMTVIQAGGDPQTMSLACLLLKKYFLDERKSEENLEQLTLEDVSQMKAAMYGLLNMEEPMSLLRRKAEILCKLHKKEESYAEQV